MDEFGSPIAGGIRGIRRNLSSSFFGAPQNTQPQADTVTTNLLQQQSLSLTNVSQQLQNISRQITSLNFNLEGVKENLALSEQLEKQRAAEQQKRERILAEQGLREGKESQLEAKIQSSLTKPLERIGIKTQGVLGRLQNFFLILAGGWLTSTGIDLLQSLSEGNVDKINQLKTKFIGGLAIIAGTLTAISLGVKKVLGTLGVFSGLVARVAFGNLLRASLNGVRVLLSALVRKAAGLGGLFGGGGIGQTLRSFIDFYIFDQVSNFFRGKGGKSKTKTSSRSRSKNKTKSQTRTNSNASSGSKSKGSSNPRVKVKTGAGTVASARFDFFSNKMPKFNYPGPIRTAQDLLSRGKDFISAKTQGLNPLKNTIKNLFKKLPGKGTIGKILGAIGVKGGLGGLLKKAGGPLGSFIFALAMGEGIGSALLGTAGFAAGAALGQAFIPIPVLGALIGGILGEVALRKMFSFAKNFLGNLFGQKDKKKDNKNENIKTDKDENSGDGFQFNKSEKTYTAAEIDAINAGASLDQAGNVIPINKNEDRASQISEVDEGGPEIITIPGGGGEAGMQGGGAPSEKISNTLPLINFDNNNPHTLYATSVTGAGV